MKAIGKTLFLTWFVSVFAFADVGSIENISYVYDKEDFGDYFRELVFLDAEIDGTKIPVYVAYPKKGLTAVAILLHGITGHKDVWWQGTGPYSSRSEYAQALLDQGVAVIAMDARYHGQRAAEFGYLNPKVELFYKKNINGLYKMLANSLSDVDSVINYIKRRADMQDLSVGILGDSMGGIMGYSLAAQGKIDFLVSLVAAPNPVPASERIHKISPLYLAPKINTPIRVIVATQDVYYSVESAKLMFSRLASEDKKLIILDEPHDFQNTHANEIAYWIVSTKEVASVY